MWLRRFLFLAVAALFVLHNDLWLWNDASADDTGDGS